MRDSCSVLGDAFQWIDKHDVGDTWYRRGPVFTQHGIVVVYTEPGYLKLYFIWQGNLHERAICHNYSDRYCVTLAKRFAAGIVGE